MNKKHPILKEWRDRMAWRLRKFRQVRGRWPDKQIISAAKNAFYVASQNGVRPPYLH